MGTLNYVFKANSTINLNLSGQEALGEVWLSHKSQVSNSLLSAGSEPKGHGDIRTLKSRVFSTKAMLGFENNSLTGRVENGNWKGF